jgi:hypothetical protein
MYETLKALRRASIAGDYCGLVIAIFVVMLRGPV